jgi:hypothetical protein
MPAAQIGSSVGGASYNTWFTSDNADINVADGRVAARKGIIGASASAMGVERRRKRRLMNNSPDTYFKTVLSVDPSDVDTMCECREAPYMPDTPVIRPRIYSYVHIILFILV